MTALLSPPAVLRPAALPVPAPPRLTIEEFIERYQGTNAEYVDGVVKEPTMPTPKHGKICMRLGGAILTHVDAQDCGHVMGNDSWFRTGPTKMRGGDVSFYSYERLPKGPVPDGDLGIVPDLVGEVKSPSDRWIDLFAKVIEYLGAGVRVVLVVDAETATASLYRPGPVQHILEIGDTLSIPDVLPGFSLPVARLFA